MSEPRLLMPRDIPQCMRLKQLAGWNQTAEDWGRLLELEPEGCFGIEQEGRLVATTTAICYGRRLAWIGMVLTDPEFRGRGLASRLMRRALEYLDDRRIEWVKLDATEMGKELYRKFGFVEESPIERWCAACGAGRWPAQPAARGEPDLAMDLHAFGADRSALLKHLAAGESAAIPGSGYAMGRPGSNAAYFGPCVATSPETARRLVGSFLVRHSGEPVYWDLLPGNAEAVSLARHFGFEPVRKLVRMARGKGTPLKQNEQQNYAIAGFEFG